MANYANLKKALDAIKAAPEHKFWMNDFVCVKIGLDLNNDYTYSIHRNDHWEMSGFEPYSCKTAYCIAGWGAYLSKGKDLKPEDAYDEGQKYFDLTREEAEYMFYGEWSENGSRATRDEAIKYLEAVLEAQSITPVEYPAFYDEDGDEYYDNSGVYNGN